MINRTGVQFFAFKALENLGLIDCCVLIYQFKIGGVVEQLEDLLHSNIRGSNLSLKRDLRAFRPKRPLLLWEVTQSLCVATDANVFYAAERHGPVWTRLDGKHHCGLAIMHLFDDLK